MSKSREKLIEWHEKHLDKVKIMHNPNNHESEWMKSRCNDYISNAEERLESVKKVIYVDEGQKEYTKWDILTDITNWMNKNNISGGIEVRDQLFDYVIGLCDWQSPCTILDEIDEIEMESLNLKGEI